MSYIEIESLLRSKDYPRRWARQLVNKQANGSLKLIVVCYWHHNIHNVLSWLPTLDPPPNTSIKCNQVQYPIASGLCTTYKRTTLLFQWVLTHKSIQSKMWIDWLNVATSYWKSSLKYFFKSVIIIISFVENIGIYIYIYKVNTRHQT